MAVGSKGLWKGLRVRISRHHVEPGEPLDAPVRLLGRGAGGFSGDWTFLENLDYTRKEEM